MTNRRSATTKILKSTSSFVAMLTAGVLMSPSTSHAIDAGALPENGTVVGGSATLDYGTPNKLDVHQGTDRVVIDWDSFNIGTDATTQFYQPGTNSLAVNRVYSKGADPTQILGKLIANGKVMVLDRNGVIFGKNSVVDVGGIIASTGDINVGQVMSGAEKINLSNFGSGAIVNNGLITASESGIVALVGPNAANNGVINAKLGKVALAAGEKATVDLYGDGLIEIAADSNLEQAIVSNTGTINAEGGTVQLTAQAAKNAVDNVINMDGVVDVSSVKVEGGKIILGGNGTANIKGKLKSSNGKIDIKSKNINVANTAEITNNGDDAKVDMIADDHMDFRGNIQAVGGDVEVSGKGTLGFDGLVEADTLLLDPTWAVIHSGAMNNPLGFGYVLSAQALANSMKTGTQVTVQADDFIDVGTRIDGYNTGSAAVDGVLNFLVGTGDIDLSTWSTTTFSFPSCIFGCTSTGTTVAGIKFQSDTVNFNKNLIMGNGNVTVNADTVNLGAKIYEKNGTTLLGDSRISSNADTVNVKSNAASIQQGVWLADDAGGATVNVGNGTYNENVLVNKGLKLQSVTGRGSTIINGIAGTGALGTIVVADGVNNVQIGDTNKGFTINGFDSANPGIENAALYFQGDHNNATVKGNEIVAKGDSALATEYGRTNSNFTIDGNTFSGKTYNGASGAWGVGDQFTVANVPRQLVALNLGHSNLTFSNNQVVGDAGDRQLVALESNGATVSGNTFDGLSTAAALRVRGSDVSVTGNTIDGNSTVRTGIQAQNVAGLDILGNTIYDVASGWNNSGINVLNGSDIVISGNTLSNVGGQSIYVEGPYGAPATTLDILNNNITDAEHNGIYVKKWNGADIEGNEIDGTTYGHGILLELTTGTDVLGNTVKNAAGAGIDLYYGNDGTKIQTNTLTDNKYGIQLENVGSGNTNTLIGFTNIEDPAAKANTITGGEKGVKVEGGGNLRVAGNVISGQSDAGIDIKNSGGDFNIVYFNKVNSTGSDGIRVAGTTANIGDNRVGLLGAIGGNGISTTGGDTLDILANQVSNAAKDGIIVSGATTANVNNNVVKTSGDDGIDVRDVTGVATIKSNEIDGTANNAAYYNGSGEGHNGIEVRNLTNAVVDRNTVKNAGNDGIEIVNNVGTKITNNKISNSAFDGISTEDGSDLVFEKNTVTNSGSSGIAIHDTLRTTIQNGNNISNSVALGIYGQNTNGIKILDNIVTNSGTGASTGASYGTGIGVESANGVEIKGNTVTTSKGDGISVGRAINNGSGTSTNVTVDNNKVTGTGSDGIIVTANATSVSGNSVDATAADGIDVRNSAGVLINNNKIGYGANGVYGTDDTTIGGNGINLIDSAASTISGNKIAHVTGDGVFVDPSPTTTVTGTTLDNIGGNAVHILDSNNSVVTNNLIGTLGGADNIGGNGVLVETSNDTTVTGNTIKNIVANGISVLNSARALIGNVGSANANKITDVKGNGVSLVNSLDSRVLNNDITNSKNGVYGDNTVNLWVYDNDIVGAKDNGVYVKNSNGASHSTSDIDIWKNRISGSPTATGVRVENSAYATVGVHNNNQFGQSDGYATGNVISGVKEGIVITDSANSMTRYNTVNSTNGTGVNIKNSATSTVQNNRIGTTGSINGDGILLETSNGSVIRANTISNTVSTGTDVGSGVHVVKSDNVTVGGAATGDANVISNTGWDGVKLTQSNNTTVRNNKISNVTRDGVYSKWSPIETISDNIITGAGLHGVRVQNSTGVGNVTISGNKINTIGSDGIRVESSNDVVITDNTIGYGADGLFGTADDTTIGRDGIRTAGTSNATIDANFVANAGRNGIYVSLGGSSVTGNFITGNTVNNTGDAGVRLSGSEDTEISGNFVGTLGALGNIGGNAIDIANSTLARIIDNLVSNAVKAGINVQNMGAGTVEIAGNTVTDSDTGMNFESGLIDLTGNANTINGGRVGYHFEPTGLASVNLVGDTIGSTVFNGQSQYYVELANGALFNPGTPTIIDGTFASYDGFVPNSVGNILTQAQYDALESKIYHYNDLNSLGLFFFGSVPGIDQSDLFRDIDGIPGVAGRFSITIRGLPRIAGVTTPALPATGGGVPSIALASNAASLNSIETAAGEDDEQSAQQLQNIQPAAGAGPTANVIEANSWNAAIDAASRGQEVTYSFSGDGADIMRSGL